MYSKQEEDEGQRFEVCVVQEYLDISIINSIMYIMPFEVVIITL